MASDKPTNPGFRERHIRCSQGHFGDGRLKIYKHDSSCQFQDEHVEDPWHFPPEPKPLTVLMGYVSAIDLEKGQLRVTVDVGNEAELRRHAHLMLKGAVVQMELPSD